MEETTSAIEAIAIVAIALSALGFALHAMMLQDTDWLLHALGGFGLYFAVWFYEFFRLSRAGYR